MSSVDLRVPIEAHVYELWANGGVDPWRSSDLKAGKGTFLCYGPRGCGKTFLANAFFRAAGKQLVQLDSVSILKNPDKYLLKAMRDAERTAECGLLVEDVESLFTNLRSRPSAWQYFLETLRRPNADLLIFGTATRPEELQPVELDAFKFVLPVFYGDEGLREVMMIPHAEHVALNHDVDLHEVALLTEWWSGQELMELITTAPLDKQGILTQEGLLTQLRLMASNIVPENRARRMHELFQFTASYGTSQVIREEIKYRFGPKFIVPTEKVPPTIKIESLYMNHNEQIHIKQAGFVATSGAQVSGINVNQTLNEAGKNLDLAALAGELSVLIRKLNEKPHDIESRTQAVSVLTEAQTEAEKGNGQNVLKSLAKVGKWVLDVAKEIGTTVAAKAITTALGLEDKS